MSEMARRCMGWRGAATFFVKKTISKRMAQDIVLPCCPKIGAKVH
jgi:hypothetical protein